MIRLINRDTGGDTWVHEDRLEEYLAAGHRLLPDLPPAPAPEPAKPARKPRSTKKTTQK